MRGKITVYSIAGCPHCVAAKNRLVKLGLEFDEIRLDEYRSNVLDEVRERTGQATVPQIFFNGRHLGGNSDFQAIVGDELDELLAWVKATAPDDTTPIKPSDEMRLDETDENDNGVVCEPDPLAEVAQALKASTVPQKRLAGFKSYTGAFTGKQLAQWLTTEQKETKAQELLDEAFIRVVKGKNSSEFDEGTLYQLTENTNLRALNSGFMSTCVAPSPAELGEQLRKQIKLIYGQFLSEDGTRVDYDGIATSDVFAGYEQLARQLQRVNIATLDHNGKLAFFINIYNALIIHGQVRRGIPPAFLARLRFFANTSYIIGGHAFSLDEIENGILRANRRSPAALFKPFSKGDGRLNFALGETEPLIHFALVCGAKSCPPIKCYTGEHVMDELAIATEGFLADDANVKVNLTKRKVTLSMIMKWYQVDFGGDDKSVVNFIIEYLPHTNDKRAQLVELSKSKFSVDYFKYDWGSNSK